MNSADIFDVIITVNSPGEVTGWLAPAVSALKALPLKTVITVFIPPCTFASGAEAEVVKSIPGVDRVVEARELFLFLCLGRLPKGFRPGLQGIVLFLGGDLTYAVWLAKRLKYPAVAYTERMAILAKHFVKFMVPYEKTAGRLRGKGISADKIQVIGNLMNDAIQSRQEKELFRSALKIGNQPLLLLLPGSRPAHLEYMTPFLLETAENLKKQIPDLAIVISISPFISIDKFKQAVEGPTARLFGKPGVFVPESSKENQGLEGFLPGIVRTGDGLTVIALQGWQYDLMSVASLAISLPGTNTFELAASGVPMIVTLPLNYPERIPLEGLFGFISDLPVIGRKIKQILLPKVLAKIKYIAWPNQLAQEVIVPELKGVLTAAQVSQVAFDLLTDSESTRKMKNRLIEIAGRRGASQRLGQVLEEVLEQNYPSTSKS
jgi:lipid-A-disaccharide synthase